MTFLTLSRPPSSKRISIDQKESPTENAVFLPRVLLIAFLMLSGTTLALAKDIAVVSNKAGSVGVVTMVELVKLCKAQTNRWPDGKAVTIFVRDPASPDMRIVLEKIYTGSAADLNDLIATTNRGRAGHPAIVVVSSDDELVRKVAATPGSIGLVDVYAINSSVEVVKIAGKLPFEPGYPLHGN
jgi:ABC-type phosphate transport system substrate-binding protein